MVEESHIENGDLAHIPGRYRQERLEADMPINSASAIQPLQNGFNNKVKNLRISFKFFQEMLMRRVVMAHLYNVCVFVFCFAIAMLLRVGLLISLDRNKRAEMQ